MKGSERQDGLQALRLVAALLVVITHASFYTHERLSSEMPVWSPGAIGVDIFFVISGFVMMLTADGFMNRPDGWKVFAARRVLRIVPMYWLATSIKLISLLVVPSVVLHAELEPSKVVLSYLLLPSTNVDGRFEPLLGVGWTLIFEMFFYAVFTLALVLRTNVIAFVGSVLGVCILISAFREPSWNAATMYFNPIVGFFFVGMVFALIKDKIDARVLLAASVVGLAALALGNMFFGVEIAAKARSVGGFLTASLIVLLCIGAEPLLKGRVPKWILFLGEASYALYLFHPLISPAVPEVLKRLGVDAPALSVILSVAAALVGASIIHVAIEKPVTRWLRPFVPYADGNRNRAAGIGLSKH
ncbi:acyltransferase [Stenotrophomonas sp. SAU14A_NAIMI4_5]|uniref:acyltransferase family protein n=1 Tax=Stenotrophomonas sp. SAU14A_NAIMI4_5 TaxID=2072413 RepID=UPI000D5424BF|nr:acyltransferase [Stenotrophomonas sp. SAU14A_NAIMI4_5]AWH51209.1 acyltransferase [Stenotrophomonas sp. SAU14A_NAIMI4_5]